MKFLPVVGFLLFVISVVLCNEEEKNLNGNSDEAVAATDSLIAGSRLKRRTHERKYGLRAYKHHHRGKRYSRESDELIFDKSTQRRGIRTPSSENLTVTNSSASSGLSNYSQQSELLKTELSQMANMRKKVETHFAAEEESINKKKDEHEDLKEKLRKKAVENLQKWKAQRAAEASKQAAESSLADDLKKRQEKQKLKFEQEAKKFEEAAVLYKKQKEDVQSKMKELQKMLEELQTENTKIVQQAEQNDIEQETALEYQKEFELAEEKAMFDLSNTLAKAKKNEQANNFALQKQSKWQKRWKSNPILGTETNTTSAVSLARSSSSSSWIKATSSSSSSSMTSSQSSVEPNSQNSDGSNSQSSNGSVDAVLSDFSSMYELYQSADAWEKDIDQNFANFEDFFQKWQNWANDANSGNYKLANKQLGSFDNGQFNVEKQSAEFFGSKHVKNDWKFGNQATNTGFAAAGGGGQSLMGGLWSGGLGGSSSSSGSSTSGLGGFGGFSSAGSGGYSSGGFSSSGASGSSSSASYGGSGAAGFGQSSVSGIGKYSSGDAFWDDLLETWKREVGEVYDTMLQRFKDRAARKKNDMTYDDEEDINARRFLGLLNATGPSYYQSS